MNDSIKRLEDGSLVKNISQKIYCKDAILATAYKFTDQAFIDVNDEPGDFYVIHFRRKGEYPLDQLVGEFSNKLIDQQIRENINKDTRELRDIVIKKAFGAIQK